MVEVSVITLKLEVKRPVVEIMKALTDSLYVMKLFHEIIVHIIKMALGYLLVRSNKFALVHFLKTSFDDESADDGNIHRDKKAQRKAGRKIIDKLDVVFNP
ncbi:hypothetical protein AB4086_07670 [Vibrio splendidus]